MGWDRLREGRPLAGQASTGQARTWRGGRSGPLTTKDVGSAATVAAGSDDRSGLGTSMAVDGIIAPAQQAAQALHVCPGEEALTLNDVG